MHPSKTFSRFFLTILAAITMLLGGCPDYSHQRPVPDYKNMTDGGAETE